MSYFTDDTIDDSTTEPLIVDPKNMPSERLDFGEHVYQRGKQIFATEHLLSPLINADDASDERRRLIEEHADESLDDIVKQYGFDPGFGAPGDETYEDAIEQYKQTLPNELKAKIFTREGLKHRAKELGRKKHDDANKKLERSNHGIFADLVGGLGAYSADPLFLATQVLAPEIAFARLAAKGVQLSQKGRIGARAGIDAVAGAGYEIPLQLGVIQPYKSELGLKHDNMDVANAVFAATVLGGVLGGTVEGVAGAYRKVKTGEWTPKQADQFIAENYDKLSPEQKEMVDMALQAQEHELANPYGPSPEGRAKHNKDAYEATKHAHSTGRKVSDDEILRAQEAIKPRDELAELQELRAQALKDAGLQDPLIRVEEPEAPITQQLEVNPLEAQFRSLTDGLEVGDELAVKTLTGAGLNEGQVREILDYAVRSGVLTKDADDKITIAKRVDDPDNPVVDSDSRLEELEARQLESEMLGLKSLKNKGSALKLQEDTKAFKTDIETFMKNNSNLDFALIESLRRELDRPNFDRMFNELESIGIIEKDGYGQYARLTGIEKELAAVYEDAKRILPKDTKFEIVETIENAHGLYSTQLNLVQLARDADDLGSTLRHEGLHALRSRLKSSEWKILVQASKKIDFPKAEIYLDELTEKYKEKGKAGNIVTVDTFKEERVANLIEYAYKGGDISHLETKPRNIIEKIISWLKAIVTTLDSPKYSNLKNILDNIENGEIAKRTPRKNINYTKESLYSKEASQDEFTINIDGEELTPEQLIRSADNDIAMAENVKLCAMMGA